MEMHLNSSLTLDDESRLAPRLLTVVGRMLESLPASYSLRIATATGNEFHHSHIVLGTGAGAAGASPEPVQQVPTARAVRDAPARRSRSRATT